MRKSVNRRHIDGNPHMYLDSTDVTDDELDQGLGLLGEQQVGVPE